MEYQDTYGKVVAEFATLHQAGGGGWRLAKAVHAYVQSQHAKPGPVLKLLTQRLAGDNIVNPTGLGKYSEGWLKRLYNAADGWPQPYVEQASLSTHSECMSGNARQIMEALCEYAAGTDTERTSTERPDLVDNQGNRICGLWEWTEVTGLIDGMLEQGTGFPVTAKMVRTLKKPVKTQAKQSTTAPADKDEDKPSTGSGGGENDGGKTNIGRAVIALDLMERRDRIETAADELIDMVSDLSVFPETEQAAYQGLALEAAEMMEQKAAVLRTVVEHRVTDAGLQQILSEG
jgi:hypothetical protein